MKVSHLGVVTLALVQSCSKTVRLVGYLNYLGHCTPSKYSPTIFTLGRCPGNNILLKGYTSFTIISYTNTNIIGCVVESLQLRVAA
jgi:hypothetical protein